MPYHWHIPHDSTTSSTPFGDDPLEVQEQVSTQWCLFPLIRIPLSVPFEFSVLIFAHKLLRTDSLKLVELSGACVENIRFSRADEVPL